MGSIHNTEIFRIINCWHCSGHGEICLTLFYWSSVLTCSFQKPNSQTCSQGFSLSQAHNDNPGVDSWYNSKNDEIIDSRPGSWNSGAGHRRYGIYRIFLCCILLWTLCHFLQVSSLSLFIHLLYLNKKLFGTLSKQSAQPLFSPGVPRPFHIKY